MNNMIDNVIKWGWEKGILGPEGKGTSLAQARKMREECLETMDAVVDNTIAHEAADFETAVESAKHLKDGIGDTCVTLILLAYMHGWELEECLQVAYDEIKGRTGKMVNGQFEKDQ